MKFALAACGMDNYPPAMAPWEPHAGREEILRFAKKADSLSWDWLTIPEHLVMPTAMAEHMGTRFVEGITAASVLMGATERIHMLTFVLVLPYRHPLLLAKQIAAWEAELLAYATDRLLEIPGLRIIGTAREKSCVLSFVLDGLHPHDIGTVLDMQGVAVRTGLHCAQPAIERFGVPATARASLAVYNTREDVDALVAAIHKAKEILG